MFYNKNNFAIKNMTSNYGNLNGVFITPKETVASNGVILIRVDSVKGNPSEYPVVQDRAKMLTTFSPFVFPKDKIADVIKLFSGDKNYYSNDLLKSAVILARHKQQVEIGKASSGSFNSVISQISEEKFPDYKSLMTEKGKFINIELNAGELKKIVDFFNSFCSNYDKNIIMKVPLRDRTKALRFTSKPSRHDKEGQRAYALLMPIQAEKEEEEIEFEEEEEIEKTSVFNG